MELHHSVEDERTVQLQLGRPLRGGWAVAKRCHLGIPMVIENHPRLPDGAPFPTLFWLTCPLLVKRASRLESDGWMVGVNEELARDPSLRRRFIEALDRYRSRRDAHEPIEGGAAPGGGPEHVKCLHAHLAHQLADPPNPVGAATLARTGWPDCVAPCIADRPKTP
ncbi:MAG: DUF501 domain-containing protein [Actinomycetota bacterium]|nr:DUF501 domain-containing protein [Actinomycetota bacterium]